MKRYDIDCSSLGVPRQYSLYYAMGLALAMEGVMSACYHVCPTTITFQFDTTFMYLIAILMFMKLYQVRNNTANANVKFPFPDLFSNSSFQTRHADVSADAMVVFLGLGITLVLQIINIYYSSRTFWLVFCFVSLIKRPAFLLSPFS